MAGSGLDDGWSTVSHTHTHTGTHGREDHTGIVCVVKWTGLDRTEAKRATTTRCDANDEIRGGNTVLAFHGVHFGIGTGYPYSVLLVCFFGLSFSSVFCLFGQSKKSEKQASHASHASFIIISEGGLEAGAKPVLIWSSGYWELHSYESLFLYPNLVVVYLRYQTLVLPRQRTPTHSLPRPRIHPPLSPVPSLSNTRPETPGRRIKRRGHFHPSDSGGTGGGGVCEKGISAENPLPLGQTFLQE